MKDVIKKELDEELSDTETLVLNSLLSKDKDLDTDYLLKKFVTEKKDIERLRDIIHRSTFLNRFIKLSGNHETEPSKFLKDSYTDI